MSLRNIQVHIMTAVSLRFALVIKPQEAIFILITMFWGHSSKSAFITAMYVPLVPLLQWIFLKKLPG